MIIERLITVVVVFVDSLGVVLDMFLLLDSFDEDVRIEDLFWCKRSVYFCSFKIFWRYFFDHLIWYWVNNICQLFFIRKRIDRQRYNLMVLIFWSTLYKLTSDAWRFMIYHSNNQFYLKSKRLKCSDGILPIFSFIQLYAFLMFL